MTTLAQVILEVCLSLLVPGCLISIIGASIGGKGLQCHCRWWAEARAVLEGWCAVLVHTRLAAGAVTSQAVGPAVVFSALSERSETAGAFIRVRLLALHALCNTALAPHALVSTLVHFLLEVGIARLVPDSLVSIIHALATVGSEGLECHISRWSESRAVLEAWCAVLVHTLLAIGAVTSHACEHAVGLGASAQLAKAVGTVIRVVLQTLHTSSDTVLAAHALVSTLVHLLLEVGVARRRPDSRVAGILALASCFGSCGKPRGNGERELGVHGER